MKMEELVSQAWTRARWSGPDAEAFHREYILPMTESARSFDGACAGLEECARRLEAAISLIEGEDRG